MIKLVVSLWLLMVMLLRVVLQLPYLLTNVNSVTDYYNCETIAIRKLEYDIGHGYNLDIWILQI